MSNKEDFQYRTVKQLEKELWYSGRHIVKVERENNTVVCHVAQVMQEEEYMDGDKVKKRKVVGKSSCKIRIRNF